MPTSPIIESHIRKIAGGSAGSHHVADRDGNEWLIKPVARRGRGAQYTMTELVAASLVSSLGLPTPVHQPVILPDRLVRAEPELSAAFQSGHVLGIRYVKGLDLLRVIAQIPGDPIISLDPLACRSVALAAATTDTWLWNGDRSPGSYGRVQPGSNPGNLYFAEPTTSNQQWRPTLIDYDFSFYAGHWGAHSAGDWPPEVLGTMRYFFSNRYLPHDTSVFMREAGPLIDRIEELDLDLELTRILEATPPSWLDGSHGNPIESGHIDDLRRRLEVQTGRLRSTLEDKFEDAVQVWGGA